MEGLVAKHLVDYGQFLFQQGDPAGCFVSTVLAVVGKERALRKQLTAAWDFAESWRMLMPWSNHIPTPPTLALALFSWKLYAEAASSTMNKLTQTLNFLFRV